MQKPSRRQLLLGAGIASSLLIVLLIALPLVSAHYLEQWLRQQGAANATVEDINFNPFTGKAAVTGLIADGKNGERLQVDLAEINLRWWPLASRRVYIEAIVISGVRGDIISADNGEMLIGGLVFPPPEPSPEINDDASELQPPWGFGSESLQLDQINLSYRDGTLDTRLDIHTLSLGSHFSWQKSHRMDLVMEAAINDAPLTIGGDAAAWANSPDFSGSLRFADLSLDGFEALLVKVSPLQKIRGLLGMDLEFHGHYTEDGKLELTVTGPMTLANSALAMDTLDFSQQQLHWDGSLALNLPPADGESMATLEGNLDFSDTAASESAQQIEALVDHLRWQGKVEFSPAIEATQPPALVGNMALAVTGMSLNHTGMESTLIGVEQLAANEFALTALTTLSLASLQIDGLQLLGTMAGSEADARLPNHKVVTVNQLRGQRLEIADQRVRLASLEISEPVVSLVRNADGQLAGIAAMQQTLNNQPGNEPQGAEQLAPPPDPDAATDESLIFRLDELKLSGSQWLSFQDQAIDPPAGFKLKQIDLQVEGVTTLPGELMTVALSTGDDTMQLDVTGSVGLPAPHLTAELDIQLKSLDLPPLSPYLSGYDLFRGRLSTDSRIRISDNSVNAENDLLIEKLKITSKQTSEGGGGGASLPVNVALDMLRNSDDEIRLKLPINGNLNDPNFGTGDIIRTASSKALQGAALSYATAALQPFGAMMMVGKLAAKSARPGFQPISMTPGKSALPPTGEQYLEKIGDLLTDRPGLSLTLCGVVDETDRQAMAQTVTIPSSEKTDQAAPPTTTENAAAPPPAPAISDAQLLELAASRTRIVTRYLTEKQGIAADRLFTCREHIDASQDASPRVDITL